VPKKNEVDIELRAIDKISGVLKDIKSAIKDLEKLKVNIDLKSLDASITKANSKLSSAFGKEYKVNLKLGVNDSQINSIANVVKRKINAALKDTKFDLAFNQSGKKKVDIDTSSIKSSNKSINQLEKNLNKVNSSLEALSSKKNRVEIITPKGLPKLIKDIRTLSQMEEKLRNVSITVNASIMPPDAAEKIRSVASALKDINKYKTQNIRVSTQTSSKTRLGQGDGQRNTKINDKESPLNSRWHGRFEAGRVADYFTEPKGLAQLFSNVVRFLGRSSKGIGSAGEATAGLVSKLSSFGSVATGTAIALGGVIAVASAVGSTFTMLLSVTSQFGDALQQVVSIIYKMLEPGIKLYNDSMKAEMAIAAGIRTSTKIDGREVTSDEAKSGSRKLVNQAIQDAAASVFDPLEIINALQGTLPMLLNKGMNVAQAYDVTKGVAGVAKLTRLSNNQVLQETRDLAQGSISARSSQVASTLGITNEDLKQFEGKADELFDYLMKKFEAYSETLKEYANTPIGAFEQLQETIGITGKAIVEQIAGPFTTVFQTLTSWLGAFRDKSNNLANSLGYLVDKEGDMIDVNKNKVKDSGLDPVQANGDVTFHLTPEVQEFADKLKETLEFAIQKFDEFMAHIGKDKSPKQTIDDVFDGIKLLITVFEWLSEVVADFTNFLYTLITGIIELKKIWDEFTVLIDILGAALLAVNPPLGLFILVLNNLQLIVKVVAYNISEFTQALIIGAEALGVATLSLGAFFKAVLAGVKGLFTGGISGAKEAFKESISGSFDQDGRIETLKRKVDNDIEYLKKNDAEHQAEIARLLLGNEKEPNKVNTFMDMYKNGQEEYAKRIAEMQKNNKNVDLSKLQGTAKDDDKNNKKAIQAAQKELRNAIKDMRDILKDKLDEIKDELKKNELKYKQGFMTAQQYFLEKAKAEKEQAELELQEKRAEYALTENTPFENESDKVRELAGLARDIAKATRAVEEASKDVADMGKVIANNNRVRDDVYQQANQISQEFNPISTQGMSNEEIVYRKLTGYDPKTFTDNVATGIIASFKGESLDNPRDEHTDSNGLLSMGIAQWNGDRRQALIDFGKENNSDPYDILTQIAFFLKEINGTERASFAQAMNYYNQNGQTAEAMTKAFVKYFERPEDIEGQGNLRAQLIPAVREAIASGNNRPQANISNVGIDKAMQTLLGGSDVSAPLKNLSVACVEAVNVIGSYFNPLLKKFYDDNVVNVDDLESKLRDANVAFDDFNKNLLRAGDIVFFDTKNVKNQHVMMYDGNGFVGNSSSANNNRGGVVRTSYSNMMNNWGMTPTKIAHTGISTGVGGNQLQGFVSNMTDSYLGASSYEFKKILDDVNKTLREYRANIESGQFNGYVYQIAKNRQDYGEEREKYKNMLGEDSSQFKEMEAILKQKYQVQEDKILAEIHEKTAQFLVDAQFNAKTGHVVEGFNNQQFINPNEFYAFMQRQFDHILTPNKDNQYNIASAIQDRWQDYQKAQGRGDLKTALDIRNSIVSIYDTVNSTMGDFKTKFDEYFDQYSQWLSNNQDATSLQKEYGAREISARKNEFTYNIVSKELEVWQEEIVKTVAELTKLHKKLKEITEEKAKLAEAGQDTTALDNEKAMTQTLIDQNTALLSNMRLQERSLQYQKLQAEQMKDQPEILKDFHRASKQAIEDGLVKFLTDGVNEAQSLGEALRTLIVDYLKEMQKLFAKEMIKNFMNAINPLKNQPTNFEEKKNTGEDYKDAFAAGTNYLTSKGTNTDLNNQFKNVMPVTGQQNSLVMSEQQIAQEMVQNVQARQQEAMAIEQTTQAKQQEAQSQTQAVSGATQGLTQFTSNLTNASNAAQSFASALQTASMPSSGGASGAKTGGIFTKAKGLIKSFARGGMVWGAGTSTSDSIPAMLSNGEAVLNAKAVKRLGTNFIHSVNRGDFTRIKMMIPHFATGGYVDARDEIRSGVTRFGSDIGSNISNNLNMSVALVRDEQEAMAHFMQSNRGKRIMLDFSRRNANILSKL